MRMRDRCGALIEWIHVAETCRDECCDGQLVYQVVAIGPYEEGFFSYQAASRRSLFLYTGEVASR